MPETARHPTGTSRAPISKAAISRAATWRAGTWIVGAPLFALAAGCTESWHSPVELDCSPDDTYDKIETYEQGTPTPPWDSYGDNTPGATRTDIDGGPFPTQPIEDGGRCGSLQSLLLQSSGYQDYGSGFQDYDPGDLLPVCIGPTGSDVTCPIDASGYEGIAFWARSPGAATKTVTLQIADTHSYNSSGALTTCVYNVEDAGSNGVNVYTTPASATVATGSSVASAEPPPDACGNYFQYWLITSDDWVFYQIPFSAFTQAAQPNRNPNGFDPSTFFSFTIIVDKESQLSLWFDDFGFYPKKAEGGL
ncbi:MAG TPA: hypothetical protein VEK07_17485 [Polyangiaceae bacterium]|nr:hypothetical protein [Polyangiaceae bacterium]